MALPVSIEEQYRMLEDDPEYDLGPPTGDVPPPTATPPLPPGRDPSDLDRAYGRQSSVAGARPSRGDEKYKPGWKRLLAAGAMGGARGWVNAGGKVNIPDTFDSEKFLSPGFEEDMEEWETSMDVANLDVDQISRQVEQDYKESQMETAGRVADARVAAERARQAGYEREPVGRPVTTPRGAITTMPSGETIRNPIPEAAPRPLSAEQGFMSDDPAKQARGEEWMGLRKARPEPTPAAIKSGEFVDLEQWKMESLRENEIDAKKILDDINDQLYGEELEQEERQKLEAIKRGIPDETQKRRAEIEASYQQQRQTLQYGPGSLGPEWAANPYE